MTEIILVRHGQANSTAKTEEDYDRLSELGHQQAHWLGERFAQTNGHFTRVISGDLRRHRETANGITESLDVGLARDEDNRWNELEYYTLSKALQEQHGVPFPNSQGDFVKHAPKLMQTWKDGHLDDIPETYTMFDTRIADALTDATAGGGRVLVVTSAGVIAGIVGQLMRLDIPSMTNAMLHIANSSTHRIEIVHGTPFLNGFNGLAHLDTPDRHHARTYI